MGTNTTTLPANLEPRRPVTSWVFVAAWADVWLLTTFAGGACGALCAGAVTMFVFFYSVPVGMILGAMLGLPLGLALAIPMTVTAPSQNAERLTRRLEVVGIGIGLIVSIPPNLYLLAVALTGDADRPLLGLAAAANGLAAVYACALVGRECGHDVAARHLKRFGIGAPPRWSPLNHRRASTPRTTPVPMAFAAPASDWEM